MVGQHLIDPVHEGVEELGVVLEPGSVEVQSQWGTVLFVVTIEVMVQEVVELVSGQDVGARVNHSASREVFVVVRVLSAIQFVHDHFPDGVRTGWAALQVTVAAVRHTEVHGVRPKWRVGQRSGDGRIVQESLLFHHGELVVSTDSQIWGTDSDHRVVRQVGELFDDDTHTGHFLGPVIDGSVGPEAFVIVVAMGREERKNLVVYLMTRLCMCGPL